MPIGFESSMKMPILGTSADDLGAPPRTLLHRCHTAQPRAAQSPSLALSSPDIPEPEPPANPKIQLMKKRLLVILLFYGPRRLRSGSGRIIGLITCCACPSKNLAKVTVSTATSYPPTLRWRSPRITTRPPAASPADGKKITPPMTAINAEADTLPAGMRRSMAPPFECPTAEKNLFVTSDDERLG